ncbi:MAG: class 1 fructose-bisphosphatase [Candidatus Kapaibacterium sp.]
MVIQTASRLITIDRHINREEDLHPQATGEFTALLHDLTFAIRIISREVRRAGLNDILGLTKNINIHGERVKKLDSYANEIILKSMEAGGHLCVMASEEEDDIFRIPPEEVKGKYVLVFDPLDGSSNIEVNITIGTIFSLYKRIDSRSESEGSVEDILQHGYKQVAAGYALYGSSTILAYTTGHGVNVFTYDPTLGEFILTNENIMIPTKGSQYSVNEGYYNRWSKNMRDYINYIKTSSDDGYRPYSLRYIGSAVADVHRTLYYGGIYMYPSDNKHENGKLRLVYEANPLAMIIEAAGGRASDGNVRILEKKPETIHERTPFFIGSKEDVFEAEAFLRGEHPTQQR